MSRVVLLGAGFSRNWDGWLANEIKAKRCARLHGDAELGNLLTESSDNFENALSRVQVEHKSQRSTASKAKLNRLQSAILNVFGHMNQAFAEIASMEFLHRCTISDSGVSRGIRCHCFVEPRPSIGTSI
jgi:hypothetical protein